MDFKNQAIGGLCACEIFKGGDFVNEICEVCEKEIPDGTGDEYTDNSCGYKFWVCDKCIEDGDNY